MKKLSNRDKDFFRNTLYNEVVDETALWIFVHLNNVYVLFWLNKTYGVI